jgi:hypothetical protein
MVDLELECRSLELQIDCHKLSSISNRFVLTEKFPPTHFFAFLLHNISFFLLKLIVIWCLLLLLVFSETHVTEWKISTVLESENWVWQTLLPSHSSFADIYPSIHPASLHHRDFRPPVVVHYSNTNPSWRVQMLFSHLSQQSDFTFHHSNGYLERCSWWHGPLVYAKGLCRWVLWNLLNHLSISRNLLCVLRKWSIWPHYYSTELPIAIWLQGKNSGKWHKYDSVMRLCMCVWTDITSTSPLSMWEELMLGSFGCVTSHRARVY